MPRMPPTPHPSLSTPLPHFSLRGLLHAVSPHTCWTVPMLCPLPSCLLGWWRSLTRPLSRSPARPHARTDDRWRTKSGKMETVLHSGALCTVLIMFSFVSPMSLTPSPLCPFQAAPPLSLYSFLFVCFWLQKISAALSGWGSGGWGGWGGGRVSVDLHNPVVSPVGPVVVRCQFEEKKKGEFLTSWDLGWWSGVGGVGGSRGGGRGGGRTVCRGK